MNNFWKKLLWENKGFSMVELLIAVMILSIVGVSLVAFVSQSSNTYNQSTAETDVQEEAQLTANAIIDRVIDCETQLKFYDGHETIDSSGVTSYESFVVKYKDASGAEVTLNNAKILQMINSNSKVKAIIFFDQAAKSIYFNEVVWDDTANSGAGDWKPFESAEAEVLADNVEDFTVNTSKLSSDKILEFDVTYARRDKSYKGNYQVHMRNDVVEGSDATPGGTTGTEITRVRVEPSEAHIEVKRNQPLLVKSSSSSGFTGLFSAFANGGSGVSQQFDWSMNTTSDAAGVYIDTNLGAVALDNGCFLRQNVVSPPPDPSVRSFRLIATSRQDGTKSGYATIYIDKVISVNVSPTTSLHYDESGKPVTGKNTSITFNAAVEAWNLGRGDQGVTWKLYKDVADSAGNFNSHWETPNSANEAAMNGATVVLKDSINDSFRFKVVATSVFDSAVEGEYIFYISDTIRTSNLFLVRGVNMDLEAHFLADPTAIAGDVTSLISVNKVEITGVPDYPGDFHSFISIDNDNIMYVDFDAYHDGNLLRRNRFYDELDIELKVYFSTPGGADSRATHITLPAVKALKVGPTTEQIVIRKGSSTDVTVSTQGYNVVKTSQIGVYLDNVKIVGSGSSGSNSFLTSRMLTTENGSSILGNRDNAVTEAKIRLSAFSTERKYPTEPISMIIAVDDYYIVSNKAADSYVSYNVYVANVEGSTSFIPGPGVTGFPTAAIPRDSLYHWANIPVYTNESPGTVKNLKFRYGYNGNGYELEYNGTRYLYDETYKYWRLNS
ncbi:MAG: prepilin-type N-terminal cleavage/methylation domain-containing protein [Lachnospiraceae bacterium]|nr:prepilin-type N-terminal cleavage/methylation domain-containing protein [Lachnospiraceae bacterium]